MEQFVLNDPDVLNAKHGVHVQKVRDEKYVYIIDKTSVEVEAARDCMLTSFDDNLDTRLFYSIGLRNNSAYGEIFGNA